MAASIRQNRVASSDDCSHANLRGRLEALRTRLGVRRTAQPVVTESAESPMLLPGRFPLILVPAWMLDRRESAPGRSSPLDMSVAHELVHLKRYDDWAAFAEQVVASLAAIHPLVHFLIRVFN